MVLGGAGSIVVQQLVMATGGGSGRRNGRRRHRRMCRSVVQRADRTAPAATARAAGTGAAPDRERMLPVQGMVVGVMMVVQDLLPAVVLLLLVPLEGQLRAQQLAAHVAPVARGQRQRKRQPVHTVPSVDGRAAAAAATTVRWGC
uniref:Uncharacterized protein n=1 Tax=Anopheles merus TaxID=30066 RepID=A0A182VI21_ANOME